MVYKLRMISYVTRRQIKYALIFVHMDKSYMPTLALKVLIILEKKSEIN